MSDQTTSLSARPLSPRHERFVLEFLKDGNATQAYIRAGYSPRGAQPSASRLLRDPRIAAAVAAGRQCLSEALAVDVTRLAQEYAKIAFANIGDYVSVDADGRLHIDLEKANLAQQAGILELKISNHRNPEQRQVTLKLGKLQALAALTKNIGVLGTKPAPGLTAEDRLRYQEQLDHSNQQQRRLEEELREARAALARAQARPATTGLEHPNPSIFTLKRREPDEAQANPMPQPHAGKAAERTSRRMGDAPGADCPPFETCPVGMPQDKAVPCMLKPAGFLTMIDSNAPPFSLGAQQTACRLQHCGSAG